MTTPGQGKRKRTHTVRLRPERPFTGVSGPSGPEIPKKSQKESFWGSARKSPKIPEKVEKYPKKSNFGYFSTCSGIFEDFFADPQKDSFWDFFGISGPEEGPETPVNGRSGRNRSSQNYYRQSCYSWEFIFPKLPLPLPSWNSDEFPLPLPSWRPQSPLHFHRFPITVLKVIWFFFPKITVTVTVLKCFWIRKVIISNMTVTSEKSPRPYQ